MIKIDEILHYIKINMFSTKSVNIITLIISIVIFFSLNFFINSSQKINVQDIQDKKIVAEKDNKKDVENQQEDGETKTENSFNWYIEIPAIYLTAEIKETTNMDILNTAVGHFEDTSLTTGNVGLAGHNRGYEKNYFENLKKVKKGDEIKYKYKDFEKTYIVDTIEIIRSTNWNYLEHTKNNRITLITCVENKPDYRLCVQASEKISR